MTDSTALAVLSLAVSELSDLDLALAFGAFEAALGLASALGLAVAFGFAFALGAGGSGHVMRSWSGMLSSGKCAGVATTGAPASAEPAVPSQQTSLPRGSLVISSLMISTFSW